VHLEKISTQKILVIKISLGGIGMSNKKTKTHSDKFKLKVALAAMKADRPVAELCQEFALATSQIYAWKKQLEDRGVEAFSRERAASKKGLDVEKFHVIIGKLIVERESLLRSF
jgi:transposase